MGGAASVSSGQVPQGVLYLLPSLNHYCSQWFSPQPTLPHQVMKMFISWFQHNHYDHDDDKITHMARRFAFQTDDFSYSILGPSGVAMEETLARQEWMYFAEQWFVWSCSRVINSHAYIWAIALALRCGLHSEHHHHINAPWVGPTGTGSDTTLQFLMRSSYHLDDLSEPVLSLLRLYPSTPEGHKDGLTVGIDLLYMIMRNSGPIHVFEALLRRVPASSLEDEPRSNWPITILGAAVRTLQELCFGAAVLHFGTPVIPRKKTLRQPLDQVSRCCGHLCLLLQWCHPDGSWVNLQAICPDLSGTTEKDAEKPKESTCEQVIRTMTITTETEMIEVKRCKKKISLQLEQTLKRQWIYRSEQLPKWLLYE